MKNKLILFVAALVCITAGTSCKTSEAAKKRKYMKRTYREIKHVIKDAEVTRMTDTVKVVFPSHLLFGFNSAQIRKEELPCIERFSGALNKYDKTAVMISGYTDSIGSTEYNNKLSEQRADTTKQVLVRYDIKSGRINTWGMGARHPIAPNNTEEGRARNRRVEFIILYSPEK
jgi:outer membrane protein OmpA-like peptidoglycan-associated protein